MLAQFGSILERHAFFGIVGIYRSPFKLQQFDYFLTSPFAAVA
jgi:hypothetical protein